jgi:CheY-like chemotaxis protein
MQWFRKAFGRRDDFFLLRFVGGLTAAALAVVSLAANGVDQTFLFLAGLASLILAFPWQRLAALKAGPFEFSLSQGQVRWAIDSIATKGRDKERIDAVLTRLAPDIEQARGSRVLWVDDEPLRLLLERRLLRALEIETVTVLTCREAARTLLRDNDFDLVITSLVKEGEISKMAHPRNPGVTFVQWLRGGNDESIRDLVGGWRTPVKDPVIRNLPVIFYAALSLGEIERAVRPLAGLEPGVEATSTVADLLTKTVRCLADRRSDPIEVKPMKTVFRKPTVDPTSK